MLGSDTVGFICVFHVVTELSGTWKLIQIQRQSNCYGDWQWWWEVEDQFVLNKDNKVILMARPRMSSASTHT